MSFLKKLFGGGTEPELAKGEEYEGFTIYVEPTKEAGGYRVAARITKGDKTHEMIRADVVASESEARSTTLLKAKSLIDQQGDSIF